MIHLRKDKVSENHEPSSYNAGCPHRILHFASPMERNNKKTNMRKLDLYAWEIISNRQFARVSLLTGPKLDYALRRSGWPLSQADDQKGILFLPLFKAKFSDSP